MGNGWSESDNAYCNCCGSRLYKKWEEGLLKNTKYYSCFNSRCGYHRVKFLAEQRQNWNMTLLQFATSMPMGS